MLKDLKATHWGDRLVAVINLGNSRNPEILEPMKKVLKTDDIPEVRREAAKALGKLGDMAAMETLEQAAKRDSSHEVRVEARDALRALDTVHKTRTYRKKIRQLGDSLKTGAPKKVKAH